jgi:hypothetical protein
MAMKDVTVSAGAMVQVNWYKAECQRRQAKEKSDRAVLLRESARQGAKNVESSFNRVLVEP